MDREKIKRVLHKIGLYELGWKIDKKIHPSKAKEILDEEVKYAADTLSGDSLEFLTYRIRLSIHGIEKNMVKGNMGGVNSNQLKTLISKTQKVIDLYPDYPKHGDAIVETLGVIQGFIEIKPDDEEFISIRDEFINKNNLHDIAPRVIRIIKDKKVNHESGLFDWEGYEEFIRSRHSVREFSEQIVDYDTVRSIVKVSQMCPSECNRQSCRVYYSVDTEKTAKIKPDPMVTKDVYNFMIVTVDKSMYTSHEVLQPWIDGGIFLESLIMAIHAKGMGVCPFQQFKMSAHYARIKEIVKIPDNEDIVALLGFGYLEDEFPVIETHRRGVDEVLVQF